MKKVLVVDDEPDLRFIVECYLEDIGQDFISAMDLTTAKQSYLQNIAQVGLIVTDLRYPGEDNKSTGGLDLIRFIRQQDQYVPIMIMTGSGADLLNVEDDLTLVDLLKTIPVLDKPFSMEMFQEAVKRSMKESVRNDESLSPAPPAKRLINGS